MIQALRGIQTKFNASSALLAVFPDGCFLSLAPTDVDLPVCVVALVSAVPDYNTVDSIKVIRIQFDIYTQETGDGGEDAVDAAATLKTVFDFCTMTDVAGFMEMRRTNEGVLRDDETTWHTFIEYEIWLTE